MTTEQINILISSIAIIISIFSYIDSRKAKKVQDRINKIEEKLKTYELEEKQNQKEKAQEAYVEARIIKISNNNYALKIWNSGEATAKNVNFEAPLEYSEIFWKENVPYEYLEPGKSFEEHIITYFGLPTKYEITTTWSDYKGDHSKVQIVTLSIS